MFTGDSPCDRAYQSRAHSANAAVKCDARMTAMHCRSVATLVVIFTAGVGTLVACQRPPSSTSATDSAEVVYDSPGLGLSFVVPAGWSQRLEGDALVFAGPEGTDPYFTTLTLQATPPLVSAPPPDSRVQKEPPDDDHPFSVLHPVPRSPDFELLDRVLDASYTALAGDRPPRFLQRDPTRVADTAALRYLVAFDFYERERLRAGVLLALPGGIVDLSYTAPSTLFGYSIDVFERSVDTLAVAPPDGGLP